MYRIYFRHRGETTERILYQPNDESRALISANLSLACGKAGELEMVIPSTHIEKSNIKFLSDEIIVKRDDEVLFIGRPETNAIDFKRNGKIVCSGILTYLCDSVISEMYNAYASTMTGFEYLRMLVNAHNSSVDKLPERDENKHLTLGMVDEQFGATSISVEVTDEVVDTFTAINEKIIKDYGGYLRIRIENGTRFLDYINSYGTTASQQIETGMNILDVAKEIQYGNIVTRIVSDHRDATGTWMNEKVDSDLIDQYGVIVENMKWLPAYNDNPQLFFTRANNYLNSHRTPIESVEVKAVDLHLADATISAFKLGDAVRVNLGEDDTATMQLTSISYDLLNPTNDTISLGIERESTSENNANIRYNMIAMQNQINALVGGSAPTPTKTEELIMAYQVATTSAKTYIDTTYDWKKFSSFVIGLRFRSSAGNYYFQTQEIRKTLLDGTYGVTSQNGNYNFNCYIASNSLINANVSFDFVNQKITFNYTNLSGFSAPNIFVYGIY